MTTEVHIVPALLAMVLLMLVLGVTAGLGLILRETKTELLDTRGRLRVAERRLDRVLAREANQVEHTQAIGRVALEDVPAPGGRALPPRLGIVLTDKSTTLLPAYALEAAAADFPSQQEVRAYLPAAEPVHVTAELELERAQPLPAVAVLDLVPLPELAEARDLTLVEGELDLPQDETRVTGLAPPRSEPEPDEPPDGAPPVGGRALTPFTEPVPTRRHTLHGWTPGQPLQPRTPAQVPWVLPRDLMLRTGRRAVAYVREPIEIWYRQWPGRDLVRGLWGDLTGWVGSLPAGTAGVGGGRSGGRHAYDRLTTRSWSEIAGERAPRYERERQLAAAGARWLIGEVILAGTVLIQPQVLASLRPPRRTFLPPPPMGGCTP